MENKFKNEMEITLAGEKILLRPTFQNMAMMESTVGSIAWLSMRWGAGIDVDTGKIDPVKAAKSMPSMTETSQIIFCNHEPKKYTLEEIHQRVLATGLGITQQMIVFLSRCAAGNKLAKEPSERQKKSSSKKNLVENR